jgi:hypothetical protein
MKPTFPTQGTQPWKVLRALLDAEERWVNGRYFLRELYLSQYHARIKELEDVFGWTIEHSDFVDFAGFKSYRICAQAPYGQGDEEDVELTGIEGAIRKGN